MCTPGTLWTQRGRLLPVRAGRRPEPWIDSGLITAQKRKPGLPYVITITDATDRRLRDWVANSSRITIRSPNTNVARNPSRRFTASSRGIFRHQTATRANASQAFNIAEGWSRDVTLGRRSGQRKWAAAFSASVIASRGLNVPSGSMYVQAPAQDTGGNAFKTLTNSDWELSAEHEAPP
jgi:hypothetical protein